jgi:hypothetical protein
MYLFSNNKGVDECTQKLAYLVLHQCYINIFDATWVHGIDIYIGIKKHISWV